MIQIGDKIPDFQLNNQSGLKFRLYDIIGAKNVVLFFYPKDDSPGCSREACAFRDSHEVFQEYDAEVIGISSDTIASHKRFIAKYDLPYTLLSDDNGRIRKLFGIPKTMGIIEGRVTYVIDKKGIVCHLFNSQMNFKKHVKEALSILEL